MNDIEQIECPFCAELINSKAKKCKHCGEFLDVALRAAEEAKKTNSSNVYMNAVSATPPPETDEKRTVSTLLGIGIFLMPYFFAWFTLRKGYSTVARIVSFVWLIIMLSVMAETGTDTGVVQP